MIGLLTGMASKKPETLFKEVFVEKIKAIYGKRIWIEKIQQVSIRGTPDLIACIHGLFFAFELKKDEYAHIEELQTYKLNQIETASGFSFVVYPENCDDILAEIGAAIKNHYRNII